MVGGRRESIRDHRYSVKVTLSLDKKKGEGVVKLMSACRGLGRVAPCRARTGGMPFLMRLLVSRVSLHRLPQELGYRAFHAVEVQLISGPKFG
jgi:hypothetical protein